MAREVLPTHPELGRNVRNTMPVLVNTLLFLAVVSPLLEAQASSAPGTKGEGKRIERSSDSVATGCVDEQDGRYVLLNDRTLDPIADLEAVGFSADGFAKHVGHKVMVRGSSTARSPRPLFKVRSIETVSEMCAPQNQQK